MSENNWKKFLLKSGLPFEYEIKECLVKHGCIVWDEYSYFKEDETKNVKEFLYDLDALLFRTRKSINFLIECKYKTEPPKWFFTPDPFSFHDELNGNSFFHPIDHFIDDKFLYTKVPYCNILEPLGLFALKGQRFSMATMLILALKKQ